MPRSRHGARQPSRKPHALRLYSPIVAATMVLLLPFWETWAENPVGSIGARTRQSSAIQLARDEQRPPPRPRPQPFKRVDGIDFFTSDEADEAARLSKSADSAVRRCDIDGYNRLTTEARARSAALFEKQQRLAEEASKDLLEGNDRGCVKLEIRSDEANAEAVAWERFARLLERTRLRKFEDYLKRCIIRSMIPSPPPPQKGRPGSKWSRRRSSDAGLTN